MSKMVKCKTCGADIASSAKSCPSCGAKNKKSIFTKWWFWVIVVIIAVVAVGGGSSSSDKTNSTQQATNVEETAINNGTAQTEEVIVITAEDLAKAFEDNEINANKLYKDKMVEVTGEVSDIGEALGSTYITLEAGEEFALTQAQCFFKNEEQINKIAELSKGDTVTVIGKCDGKSMNVGVNDCSFK